MFSPGPSRPGPTRPGRRTSIFRLFGAASLAITSLAGQSVPGPREPLGPERRGDIFMARKMYREAVEAYREGPQDSAILWNKIGIAYHQMMMLDAAKKNYEMAVRLNPQYSEAINNLGTVHYAKKNYRRSVSLYNRALKIAPRSASIYSNLGTAQFARKKYKEAVEAYRMALSIDPEVFEHRGAYGTLLQERSVQEKAKFHFYLAKTYANAGMNERALQYLRMAFEEGFNERQKVMEEPEFAALRELEEFKQLMASQPRVL
jgi:tetratricopeptide (TPR) repeat protein